MTAATPWDFLLALHVLGAVVWVGGMFFALLVLRPALLMLEPPQRLALHVLLSQRFFAIIWWVMPGMLLTGYGMLFDVFGGFAGAPWNVHLMNLTGLIMAVIFLLIFFGPWQRLKAEPTQRVLGQIRRLVTINLALGLFTVAIAALGRFG